MTKKLILVHKKWLLYFVYYIFWRLRVTYQRRRFIALRAHSKNMFFFFYYIFIRLDTIAYLPSRLSLSIKLNMETQIFTKFEERKKRKLDDSTKKVKLLHEFSIPRGIFILQCRYLNNFVGREKFVFNFNFLVSRAAGTRDTMILLPAKGTNGSLLAL